jgi:hypothetical protein
MSKACFTLQHNEMDFLPIWVRWYGETFKPEDMYILAHNSSPEMLEMLKQAEQDGINVEYLNTEVIFDHNWLNEQVHRKQRELLEKYDWVLFTDCDELVTPTDCTLSEFIDKADQQAYRCDGFELLNEDFMYKSIGFCKTLLSSIPLTYIHGYHESTPVFPVSESLRMYHIHRINFDKALQRAIRISQEKWDNFALSQGLGTQNRICEEDALREWWTKGVPSEEYHLPIPPEILQKIKG